MTSSTTPSINPTVVGWIVGLIAPVFGVFAFGFPLQSRLQAMDAPTVFVEGAPVVGAFLGFVLLFVGMKMLVRYRQSDSDRPPVSRHFEDSQER